MLTREMLGMGKGGLFGLPHAGAAYTRSTRRNGTPSYERTSPWCVVCGKPAENCHHLVPVSVAKAVEMRTPNGTFVLRTPLFALCGSGTTGCHDDFHGGARLKAKWEWDSEENERAWESGELLARFGGNSPHLYRYGRWMVTHRDHGLVRVIRDPFLGSGEAV